VGKERKLLLEEEAGKVKLMNTFRKGLGEKSKGLYNR